MMIKLPILYYRGGFMAFIRNITTSLNQWKENEHHKPLVIRGARQVGKTTVIKEFGKSFDTFIALNLEKEVDKSFFDNTNDAKITFQRICLERHIEPKGKTLLFLDEIQNSPQAVALLRYFYEDLPSLYVISAGSLLEIMMDKNKISFPVGRVEYMYLFPMTFQEFLLATGNNQAIELLGQVPFPEWATDTLFKFFREYTMVGGMPEVVAKYLENKNIVECKNIYSSLFTSYIDDVAKYSKNHSEEQILRTFIEASPIETGKRITFEKFANTNYRSREAGEALRMLERAMLIYLRYPTTGTEIPLLQDMKKKPRLQFLDTGLLNFKADIQSQYLSDIKLDAMFNGIIAEQIVGQELLASNFYELKKPLFWVRENAKSNAEVDFIQTKQGQIIPIEVKSGKSGTLRSLHSFIDISGTKRAVRLYSGNFSIEETKTSNGNSFTLINLPLFLADKIEQYVML